MRGLADPVAELVLTEAAAWLTRLQDEARTQALEAGFREWLADPVHARAFAQVTESWEIIPGAWIRRPVPPRRGWRQPLAAAAMVAACAVGLAILLTPRDPVYQTAVGQQQVVTLIDGTRVTLNTASKLVVSYRPGERRVRLARGEAIFEVAKNPQRPFTVQVNDTRVRALGTVFAIRSEPQVTAVTLLEGRVEVAHTRPLERPQPLAVLKPGDRFTLADAQAGVIDHPTAQAVTAWRRGQVIFDDVSLADAVAELNRYSENQIAISDPALGQLRVSGAFRHNDLQEFGQAVAQLHGLHMSQQGLRFTLHH